ncbi:hypothetical protein BDN70DRAFT_497672 [Pholiota conissans]|uniref:RING-type domain-containing protein n=1 Tax=Pholiota conissans TaxID=109636 RepID=A0A9P6D373_9AGAR|nr:hypothetical protein BDN70DRAFT_497672 [Pholiota conissans]
MCRTLQQSKRQKRRIAELEAAQAKEELQDLHKNSEEPSDGAEMDPLARMRKLLRIFSDLMITNTISSDMAETCHVCLDTLRLKKCSSLECQHILCNVCLQSIVKADQTVQCPECRRVCSRESTKPIIMTEEDRWDRLLNVAQAWDAFDRRGEMETSEEDDENSITAGSGKFVLI